jgi:NedA-like, galactose-binding domain/Domain of unknown function (DUF4214)
MRRYNMASCKGPRCSLADNRSRDLSRGRAIRSIPTCFVLFSCLLFAVSTCWSAPVNLALFKRTHQSSIAVGNPRFASGMGVDGKKYDSSMFMTEMEDNPWWEVDLGAEKKIDNVTLYNRVACCQERALHIAVLLSSDGENYRLILDNDTRVFRNKRIDIGGLSARFVRVQLPGHEQLHLQEVEVYQWGTWNPPSPTAKWVWTKNPTTAWNLPPTSSPQPGTPPLPVATTNTYGQRCADNSTFITSLYGSMLRRTPDANGFRYWLNSMNSGMTREEVIKRFFESAEYRGFNRSNYDYARDLYHTVLGREPDSGGIAYWTRSMDNGMSRSQVLTDFFNSAEYQGIIRRCAGAH